MKDLTIKLAALLIYLLLMGGVSAEDKLNIAINQLGFHANAPKIAILPASDEEIFSLYDTSDNRLVYSGKLSAAKSWELADKSLVSIADFSEYSTLGNYHLKVGEAHLATIEVNNTLNQEPLTMAIKYYFYNRASASLDDEYAGQYARAMAHPDANVLIHSSAASKNRPENTSISSPKGWYDAGDFNKYVVNSNITVYTLLAAWEDFNAELANLSLNIPESGNELPDFLDEIKWNIDWMLTMQDPLDGGVYHKLTTKRFTPLNKMPDEMQQPRYVVAKSTAASLGFAAVMAQASRVFKSYEDQLPGFSDKLLKAAKQAWNWSVANPNLRYQQPMDIATGEYAQKKRNLKDEWLWAATELFFSTGETAYRDKIRLPKQLIAPAWSDVEVLGVLSIAKHGKHAGVLHKQSVEMLQKLAKNWQHIEQNSPYRVAISKEDFVWGSSAVILNKAFTLLRLNSIENNPAYVHSAQNLLDYVLGRNPLKLSFVTGLGKNRVMNIHHRVSIADDVKAPIPGGVVGGANPDQQDKESCLQQGVTYRSTQPALSFVDHTCSFASNEVAINWNAPLVYVLAALQQ